MSCLNARILTDGHNAHCVRFILSSNNKQMEKCGHVKDKINILQAMMYFNNKSKSFDFSCIGPMTPVCSYWYFIISIFNIHNVVC